MARNAIEGDFRSSKMSADSHFVKQNVIESDFLSSKMASGSHFVNKIKKKLKLCIDLKWREMRLKVIFGHPKWGGEHHNGQSVNHSGIYTVFALEQIHLF